MPRPPKRLPEKLYGSTLSWEGLEFRILSSERGLRYLDLHPTDFEILEAKLHARILPDDEQISLGDYLPLRDERRPNYLITRITIPTNVKMAYKYVARTPADLSIVCVAVAQWPSGRTRVALGGYGSAPMLAMDGPESDGAETAARDAYREASDQWASAAYRSDVAGKLADRCLDWF